MDFERELPVILAAVEGEHIDVRTGRRRGASPVRAPACRGLLAVLLAPRSLPRRLRQKN